MTTGESQGANGTIDAADAQPLKRVVYYDRVSELEAEGMARRAAIVQTAAELGSNPTNVSSGYYAERKHRLRGVTVGVDPQAAIIDALQAIEEAVAHAKLIIASATMQYEQLRVEAAKYAELRKHFR